MKAIKTILLVGFIFTQFSQMAYASQDYKNTALHDAARDGDVEKTNQLLEDGVDVNAQDKFGWTALILAAISGRAIVVKILLAVKGIDVDAKNKDGWTALHEAALRGHSEIVNFLLVYGTDVNAKNESGFTALILAAISGHPENVEILLKYKADANVKNNDGKTATDMARHMKYIIDSKTANDVAQRMKYTKIINLLENQKQLNAKKQKPFQKKINFSARKKADERNRSMKSRNIAKENKRCAKIFKK